MNFGKGRSARSIARELGINRKSVAAAIARRLNQAKPQEGDAPRPSMLDPYKHLIQEKMLRDPAMPAAAAHQSLRRMGFSGSVRRPLGGEFIKKIQEKPFPR